MNKFTSQHYGDESPLQRKLSEVMDSGSAAMHSRVGYAECFIAHNPEVYEYLPVSEYRRNLSKRSPEEIFESFKSYPLAEVIFTEISRDGMLDGPNLTALEQAVRASPFPVLIME